MSKKPAEIQSEEQKSVFLQSLDDLKSDDLAPKTKKKTKAGVILEKIAWGAAALVMFGVFLYAGSLALRDTVDYFKAEHIFDNIAGHYSPVTGKSEIPIVLKIGAQMYPIPGFDKLAEGSAVYPDETPSVVVPSLNPGGDDGETTPDPGETTVPEPEPDPNISEEKLESFRASLEALRKSTRNKDVFAWIYIPGTNINYPVVIASQSNPNYYLNYGVDKEWNHAGSIFMDYRLDRNLLNNRFTVFYGHNIRTKGTMFNRLIEFYEKPGMFEKYRYVYVYTEEAALKYETFSVYEDHGYNSPSISILNLSDAAFLNKILAIQNASRYERKGLSLKATDHVLMLYTCSNELSVVTDNDIRCMVFGVLVDLTV